MENTWECTLAATKIRYTIIQIGFRKPVQASQASFPGPEQASLALIKPAWSMAQAHSVPEVWSAENTKK